MAQTLLLLIPRWQKENLSKTLDKGSTYLTALSRRWKWPNV